MTRAGRVLDEVYGRVQRQRGGISDPVKPLPPELKAKYDRYWQLSPEEQAEVSRQVRQHHAPAGAMPHWKQPKV